MSETITAPTVPYAYAPVGWVNSRVEAKGRLLVFDLEPVSDHLCDVMTFDTLGGALAEIETQVDVLNPDDADEGQETFTLKARWVTPEQWAREQEQWENE
jgi:hypothetical protein